MSDELNTLFLRLEGPLQAWGDPSKFVMRRTMDAPTKSGVLGLICCALGVSRKDSRNYLPELNKLAMGVRIDRSGTRWWDYHTVGAGYGLLSADGKIKRTASTDKFETLVSRREYLCDGSFLVALRGDSELIKHVGNKLKSPQWPLFLGRKSCPPTLPIYAGETRCDDLQTALQYQPWRPRCKADELPNKEWVPALVEWRSSVEEPTAPRDAEVWYDAPVCFDPPVHEARLVKRTQIEIQIDKTSWQNHTPPPPRHRADYGNKKYADARKKRLKSDQGLCVFCKQPATTVQHVTYRRAGGGEEEKDLRSLCRLCHDAVTMIEYGQGMGLDRIDPEDIRWRADIIHARNEIRRWRSEEGRRRALRYAPERVRRELLEEGEE